MRDSRCEQPLSPERDRQAARAHDHSGAARDVGAGRVYPELAAEASPDNSAGSRASASSCSSRSAVAPIACSRATAVEMATPVGVGPFGLGVQIDKRGEGW